MRGADCSADGLGLRAPAPRGLLVRIKRWSMWAKMLLSYCIVSMSHPMSAGNMASDMGSLK